MMMCSQCGKVERSPDNWIVAVSSNAHATPIAGLCSPPCAAKYFEEKFPESELGEEAAE